MSDRIPTESQYRYFRYFDFIICLPFVVLPLFVTLPYRVNIFLSWEGAYRMYLGQTPFEDFGIPMGYGYWLIPMLFFKIFGTTLGSLVKAQVLINVLSLLSIRGILTLLKVPVPVVTFSLFVSCLTYVLFNFWPWYNHTVVVFELLGLWLLLIALYSERANRAAKFIAILCAGVVMFISFFTKQDVGAIGLVISLVILGIHASRSKQWMLPVGFLLAYLITAAMFILPHINHEFTYWFNVGQPPHSARISILFLLDAFMAEALWEKVWLALILVVAVIRYPTVKSLWSDTPALSLLLITLGLIGQAIITRVTSPLPTNHMTYFHAFAFAVVAAFANLDWLKRWVPVTLVTLFTLAVIFSDGYWKYAKPVLNINREKTNPNDTVVHEPWVRSQLDGFSNVSMPKSTVDGMERLVRTYAQKESGLRVLNMTELTPLALSLNYTPPTDQPLWYHLRVGIFQREVDMLCDRIKRREYDLVLFEDIPSLNNFYPYQIRETLRQHYTQTDRFLAPRKLQDSWIEVYTNQPPASKSN